MIDPLARSAMNNHQIVARLLDPPTELPVLDIGAGVGNFTAYLVSHGYPAIALDIDRADYCDAGHSTAPFIEVNLDDQLPVAPESAAGAVAIEVFEHLESPLRTMRHIAQTVIPGGFLIITTPNVMSWASRLELLVRGHHEHFADHDYAMNGHISPTSLTQLQRMAVRLNLETEAVTYNIGRLPFPRWHRFRLTRRRFRRESLGECVIVKLRKRGAPLHDFQRG